ncbi:hypothetical protein CEXT_5551 [Caerostris extrusa]|uniref:Uncharacterized protein n=1 Tax=Caerostris extrusa TaxID=172846 RepID=A0AAV4XHV2_CAEEX|nr:hypothetical protein CEXT_5551 [Caerostris extrusa]
MTPPSLYFTVGNYHNSKTITQRISTFRSIPEAVIHYACPHNCSSPCKNNVINIPGFVLPDATESGNLNKMVNLRGQTSINLSR